MSPFLLREHTHRPREAIQLLEGGRLGSAKEKDIAVVIFFNVPQIYRKHSLECFYDDQGLTSYQGLNSKWQH